jgi:hypothetical protein
LVRGWSPKRVRVRDERLWWGFPPDFLWRAVALMDFMRLSLKRAAHVALASSAK